ncbi:MAG: Crp/Fnr family transcriptional regulator [Sphingomonadaceae bacterium]
MSNCDACLVSGLSICSVLTTDERTELGSFGHIKTVKRGQTLQWEGEDSLFVANVIDGLLKLSTATSDGREQIVGLAFPSDFLGQPFHSRNGYTATALVDSRVCLFTRTAFDAFTLEHPELGHDLLLRTMDELKSARHWLLLLGRKSAGEKISSFLLELSRRMARVVENQNDNQILCPGAEPAPLDRITLPVDRQQIADILGLTIETVSRQFSHLRAIGVIELPDRRTVEILDRAWLQENAGN